MRENELRTIAFLSGMIRQYKETSDLKEVHDLICKTAGEILDLYEHNPKKPMDMEKEIKKLGFNSLNEYHTLVSNVDLTSVEKIEMFELWKKYDGTKEGLLKLK